MAAGRRRHAVGADDADLRARHADRLERLDVGQGALLERAGDEQLAVRVGLSSHAARSTRAASPMPPETQSVAMPRPAPRASSPCSSVTRMRAPVAPMGWPKAMAP